LGYRLGEHLIRLIISYAMFYLREHPETTAGDFAEPVAFCFVRGRKGDFNVGATGPKRAQDICADR